MRQIIKSNTKQTLCTIEICELSESRHERNLYTGFAWGASKPPLQPPSHNIGDPLLGGSLLRGPILGGSHLRSYFRRVCFSVCVYNAPPPPLQELREHRLRVPGILKRFKAWCFLFQPSWLKASGETQPYIGLLSPRPPPRAERELHLQRSAWSRSIETMGRRPFRDPPARGDRTLGAILRDSPGKAHYV